MFEHRLDEICQVISKQRLKEAEQERLANRILLQPNIKKSPWYDSALRLTQLLSRPQLRPKALYPYPPFK